MRRLVAVLLAVSCASAGVAQRDPTTSDPVLRAREDAIRAAFMTMPDTPGTGPYKAIKEVDPGLANHVVYRPANFAALGGKKLGVIIWGNGGCRGDGASARQHLAEIASHGYVTIAPGTIQNGPGIIPPNEAGHTTTADVLAGLDWALAENARKGSRYYGRIDPKLTGVGGTSCGGLQSMQASADPRIHAVIIHNSGVFAETSRNPNTGAPIDKSQLEKFHTPVLYMSGGPADVSFPNATDDFQRIGKVPVVLVSINVGHGGTLREKNGGAGAKVAVAWYEWQLRGDRNAAKMFTGKSCGLCGDKAWTVERKGIE